MKKIAIANNSKALILVSFFIVLIKPAYSETTVGRWCDKMIPTMPQYNNTMAIVINDKGEAMLKTNYADGSFKTYALRELSGGIYEKSNSTHSDKYRIIPNHGDLQLLDNDGLIRVAKRLENAPKSGECK